MKDHEIIEFAGTFLRILFVTQYVICNRVAVVPVLFCGGGNRARRFLLSILSERPLHGKKGGQNERPRDHRIVLGA